MHETVTKRRSGIRIMGQLIGLVKPLWPFMVLSILLGTVGYACANFLTVVAVYAMLHETFSLLWALVVMAVLRGIFHFGEQYCNHFIAFRLLAIIRHQVFAKLRTLAPAKLEGKNKGDLVSLLTSDIELLEVFYAHTISPIVIAVLSTVIMFCFFGQISLWAMVVAAIGYIAVGICIPLLVGKFGKDTGMKLRNELGELNTFVLDSLRGVDEIIQYDAGEKRTLAMKQKSRSLGEMQKRLNGLQANQSAATNLVILGCSFGMLFVMLYQWSLGQVSLEGVVLATVGMMSSFGPVVALANLANNLNQTLACGERVLSLLEDEPQVREVMQGERVEFSDVQVEQVSFAYETEKILSDVSLEIPKGSVLGIHGPSGSGKSTLLKLLMRFWDPTKGKISIQGKALHEISTDCLREMESYVTQETYLFQDTIGNNIAIGKPGATKQEIQEAAKKASLHEWICSLPNGYETKVGELGDTLSGGEKQRIGIARAFLHDTPLLLLDEPTSNLDALNEGIILKSLKDCIGEKTAILVSHRKSTLQMASHIFEMDRGRIS